MLFYTKKCSALWAFVLVDHIYIYNSEIAEYWNLSIDQAYHSTFYERTLAQSTFQNKSVKVWKFYASLKKKKKKIFMHLALDFIGTSYGTEYT